MAQPLLFSDFFQVDAETVEDYGAFNVSLIADLPLFIDPFLLFNSEDLEYQRLHQEIIDYVFFLYEKSMSGVVDDGLLEAWYRFKEVKQTWLGFSRVGNRGSGLGRRFASALNANFPRVFKSESDQITRGRHLEKFCLIADRVGRDNISDFTTNLIKHFLLDYTQTFARENLAPRLCQTFRVPHARFNYQTESWETRSYYLPAFARDFVILVPEDLLMRDDTWINRSDLFKQFDRLPASIPDTALRSQINQYFRSQIPRRAKEKDIREAARRTLARHPELVDYYIRLKEETGDQAQSVSASKVEQAHQMFLQNFVELVELLRRTTRFYDFAGNSYDEALARVRYLKQVVESNNGYRLFYDGKGRPIQREEDLQVAYKFTWFATTFDVNREVDNGRGPVDYKVSRGSNDKCLVEFKLASNTQIKKNLANQVQVYEAANETNRSIKVILYFTAIEKAKVDRVLQELELTNAENVVLIDARRDNKQSGSKAG